MLANIFTKIAKATGRRLGIETANAGANFMGGVNAGVNITEFAAKHGKKLFKEIPKEERMGPLNAILPYTLKSPVAWGIAGVMSAYDLASDFNDKSNRASLGDIESGEMANMVSITRSPTLNNALDQVDAGNEEFTDRVTGTGSNGADAEIVFALHELRNNR